MAVLSLKEGRLAFCFALFFVFFKSKWHWEEQDQFTVVTLKPKSFFYGAKQLGFNLRRQWGLKVCFQPSKYINIFVDFIVHVPQSTTVV